jgi:plastocyanin
MRRFRTLLVAVSVLTLVGAACSDDNPKEASATTTTAAPTGSQTYTVVVDGPSALGSENLVYGAFYPRMLTAHAGDTIAFDNRSSNDVHTATLGVKSDRSDQPIPVSKKGQTNPAVFGPCTMKDAPRSDMVACPAAPAGAGGETGPVAEGASFHGTGYWNSGLILFSTAAPEAGAKTVRVKLAADIAPGPYAITCLLHPFMQSTLQVVPDGEDRLSPSEVVASADRELGEAKAAATGITVPTQAPVAGGTTVAAGWGDKLVAVNRFSPETASIKVGEKVTWSGKSPYMPHTVSFESPFRTLLEPGAFLPAGTKPGGKFTGGVSHSGAFGPPPEFPTETFSLVFTKAGTYPYACLLHPGMAGTVQVS